MSPPWRRKTEILFKQVDLRTAHRPKSLRLISEAPKEGKIDLLFILISFPPPMEQYWNVDFIVTLFWLNSTPKVITSTPRGLLFYWLFYWNVKGVFFGFVFFLKRFGFYCTLIEDKAKQKLFFFSFAIVWFSYRPNDFNIKSKYFIKLAELNHDQNTWDYNYTSRKLLNWKRLKSNKVTIRKTQYLVIFTV